MADAAVSAPLQDVSVTDEVLPKSQMQLTVTVSARLCTAQYNKEIAYFQKNTAVPGFRKGGKKGKKVGPASRRRSFARIHAAEHVH